MRLYYSRPSPFARKALVALIETNQIDNVTLEEVKISPLDPGDIVPKVNPLGKIPTLILPDGSSLSESKFICRYIDELNNYKNSEKLYPIDENIWKTLQHEALSDGILEAAVLLVYEKRIRTQQQRVKEWVNAQQLKISRTLEYFEDHTSELEKYVDMGSLTVAIALDYLDFRHDDINWKKNCPTLSDWHKNIKDRKSLVQTSSND